MDRYIYKLIHEQFNIGDMDLNNNKLKHNANIFNKALNHPYYYNVLDGTATESEIKELNSLVGIAVPKDKDELIKIIEFYSENYPEDSLNWLDVYKITDMCHLFEETEYNGDISKWNTSNVTDMSYMFDSAYVFNQRISNWDVSNVNDMSFMFAHAKKFNRPIGDWDVSNVTNMQGMFLYAYKFNQPINNWHVNNVTDMENMFYFAYNFDQPIGDWDVSHVTDMSCMFYAAFSFNQDISGWNINNVKYNTSMYEQCPIKEEYKPKKIRKKR